jgi:hypothetical protein
MTQPQTIASEWASFEEEVLSKHETTPVERRNMRRVFFCGAFSFYHLLQRLGAADEATVNAATAELERELNEFFVSLPS